MNGQALGLSQFWAQADVVIRIVAALLLLMSVASWAIILAKCGPVWRARRGFDGVLERFWQAPSWDDGIAALSVFGNGLRLVPLVQAIASVTQPDDALQMQRATRALRAALRAATKQLDAGMGFIASVGATAPFIGLLGTVWGIYRALTGIAAGGQLTISRVAGPVGESLIMTALGLAVAIPAVLAYNALSRAHRVMQADLDSFARDLHAAIAAPD